TRDGIYMEAHDIDRQRFDFDGTKPLDRRRDAHRPGPLSEITPGDDGDDPRYGKRLARVNRHDAGMRVGRAHEARMQGPAYLDVVDVAAVTCQQAVVLRSASRPVQV